MSSIFVMTRRNVLAYIAKKQGWGLLPKNLKVTNMVIDHRGIVKEMSAKSNEGGLTTEYWWELSKGESTLLGYIVDNGNYFVDDSINIYV